MFKKNPEKKIVILTCYDFPTARAMDTTAIDAVLVGDSVGTNILGYASELQVTMDDMIHHLKAVRRGITAKTLIVDLPYNSYSNIPLGVSNATLFASQGADIVKLEGGKTLVPTITAIVETGVAVMGHIGFQPQIAQNARRAVVGALVAEATALFQDAVALQAAGVCSLVLECVPESVAKEISSRLSIPTIGIGSGRYTDGQVLVSADIVGWYNHPFRFVKRYDTFFDRMITAANQFVADVQGDVFPQRSNAFGIKAEQLEGFIKSLEPR